MRRKNSRAILAGKATLIAWVATLFSLNQSWAEEGIAPNKIIRPPIVLGEASADTNPNQSSISADFPYESKFVEVLGSKMHYIERGEGDPILFIHGIPTSSYLWRNVLPFVEGEGRRIIAVDLIGFGKSDKPDIKYGFEEQARYLEAFIEALALENVTLVMHDWGAGLGLYYAWNHPDNIKAIASSFLELASKPTRAAVSVRMSTKTLVEQEI